MYHLIYKTKETLKKHRQNIRFKYQNQIYISLPKGGLVISTPSQRDIDIISEKSQQIFPGCILNQPKENNQSITVVQNINSRISSEDVEEEIKNKYNINCQIRRYHSNITKYPFPIVSIKTNPIQTEIYLKEGIHIFDKHYPCEVYKPPLISCFNCQRFGHIALYCNSSSSCINCAHPSHGGLCQNPLNCINCQGPHKASSTQCPKFILL